jgi:NAD(P)-dependent dehydrogenase (short-subunit alcohol dehydrogenase family)
MTRAARRLDHQVALVTGAGRGIGRAIAQAFAAAGARVLVADLRPEAAYATASSIAADAGEARAVQVDVSSPASQDALFAALMDTYGRLDVLVNNAGIFHVAPFLDVALDDWRRVFAVNLDGALLATQRAGRLMMAQEPHPATGCRGKVVNIGSPAAERGRPFLPAYGASKAALNHLSRTSAVVLGEHLIATTVLYPTSVREGMFGEISQQMAPLEGSTPAAFEQERAASSPTGRLQDPSAVAEIALWVAALPGMDANGRLVHTEAHMTQL